jgi:hypothetical protein
MYINKTITTLLQCKILGSLQNDIYDVYYIHSPSFALQLYLQIGHAELDFSHVSIQSL